MLKRRTILENLTRETLLHLASTFDLSGLTGKRKDEIVEALQRKKTF